MKAYVEVSLLLLAVIIVTGAVYSEIYNYSIPNPSTEKNNIQVKDYSNYSVYFLKYNDLYIRDISDLVHVYDYPDLTISNSELREKVKSAVEFNKNKLIISKVDTSNKFTIAKSDFTNVKSITKKVNKTEVLDVDYEDIAEDDIEFKSMINSNDDSWKKYIAYHPEFHVVSDFYFYIYDSFCYVTELQKSHRFYKSGSLIYKYSGNDLIALKTKNNRFSLRSCGGTIKLYYTTTNKPSTANWIELPTNKYVVFDESDIIYVKVDFKGNGKTSPLMIDELPLEFVGKENLQSTETLTGVENSVIAFNSINYVPSDYKPFIQELAQYVSLSIVDDGILDCSGTGFNFVCDVPALNQDVSSEITFNLSINISGVSLNLDFSIPYTLQNNVPDLYSTQFIDKNLSFNTDYNSVFDYNLRENIYDQDGVLGAYALSILSNPNYLDCNIVEHHLHCIIPESFIENDSLSVELHDVTHNTNDVLLVNFIFVDNNPVQFSLSETDITISHETTINHNLVQYLTDADGALGNYEITISSLPVSTCEIQNENILHCSLSVPFVEDSLTLSVKDLKHNTTDSMIVNLEGVDLYPLRFEDSSLELKLNPNSTYNHNLVSMLSDADETLGDYEFTITIPSVYVDCDIYNNSELRCNTPDLFVSDSLTLTVIDTYHSYSDSILINITSTNGNATKFSSSNISKIISENSSFNENLVQYLTDADGSLGNYELIITEDPEYVSCDISNNSTLNCSVAISESTTDSLTVQVKDTYFNQTDELTVDIDILLSNRPPQIISNPINKTLVGETLTATYSISDLVYDSDDSIDTLDFSYSLNGLNSTDLTCVKEYPNIVCSFSESSLTGDAELSFTFNDLENSTTTEVFHLNHVSYDSLESIILPGSIYNVYHGSTFDYTIKVGNTLGFDLYNLDFSYVKESSNSSAELTINSSSGFSNFDLPYDSQIITEHIFSFNLTTPESEILNADKIQYNLFLKDNSTVLRKLINENTFNSTPLTKDFADEFLDVDVYIPGIRPDGQNTYIPVGVIIGVPYIVTNSLDIPVNLYVCELSEYSDATSNAKRGLYTDTFVDISNNLLCEQKTIDSIYEDQMYVDVIDVANGGFSRVYPYAFLDTTPTLENGSALSYLNYKESSNTFLLEDSTMNLTAQWEYDDPVYKLSSSISTPSSGATLNRNTTYTLTSNFTNRYAFPVYNLDVCARVGYSMVLVTSEIEWSIDNYFASGVSPDCQKLDLNYYVHNGTNINTVKTLNYQFTTKDNVSTNPPYFSLSTGYLVGENYFYKGTRGSNIQ